MIKNARLWDLETFQERNINYSLTFRTCFFTLLRLFLKLNPIVFPVHVNTLKAGQSDRQIHARYDGPACTNMPWPVGSICLAVLERLNWKEGRSEKDTEQRHVFSTSRARANLKLSTNLWSKVCA